MDFTISPLIVYLLSWLGLMGGVWSVFERAESVSSNEAKKAVAHWLLKLELPSPDNWPASFSSAFDSVFGRKHLSIHCFIASSVASLISVTVLVLFRAALRPSQVASFTTLDLLIQTLFLALLINIVPDYVSLLETRYVLRCMSRARSNFSVLALLVLDVLATAVVIVIPLLAVALLLEDDPPSAWSVVVNGVSFGDKGAFTGIFFYSTYSTSLWLWLYAASGLLLRASHSANAIMAFLRWSLDIEAHPLRSLGFVSMLLITVIYIAMPFLI